MDSGKVVDRALMDYVVVTRRIIGRVLDVNVYRGENGGISDHYLVEGKLRVDGRWKRRRGGGREVLKVSVLNDKDKEHEYQERLRKVWNEVKERGEDGVKEE